MTQMPNNLTCFIHSFPQIYNEKRNQFEIKKNSPKELVEKVASDIEKLLAKKRKALEVSLLVHNAENHILNDQI